MSTDGAIDTRILRRLDAGRIYNQQTESIGKMAGRGGDDEMGGQEQRMNADNIWLKFICPSHQLPSLASGTGLANKTTSSEQSQWKSFRPNIFLAIHCAHRASFKRSFSNFFQV